MGGREAAAAPTTPAAAPSAIPTTALTPVWRRPAMLLAVVAALHAVSPIVLLGVHWWFGIDETVYLSQLNAHVPAGVFSAPRARGATLIAAPVTLLTTSVAAVRIWVAIWSGIGFYLAFRPWLRLRPGYVVPLAALMFASIWTVIYYGFEVMPNEWVAFGVLAACGYALLFLAAGRPRHLVGIAVPIALVALLRPSDAVYAGVALGVSCLVGHAPARRRVQVAVAVLTGIVLGVAEWIVEAFTSFGGLTARIHAAQGENGGGGLHYAGAAQARALAGPLLCRDGCAASAGYAFRFWWIGLGVLLVVAVVATARERSRPARLRVEMVPLVVGLAVAAEYFFTVTYAAPRFLIPAYALLSLPAASAVVYLVRSVRSGAPRLALALALVAVFVAHTAVQANVVTAHVGPDARRFDRHIFATARGLRAVGVRAPCLLLGDPGYSQNLAYATGCANGPRGVVAVRRAVRRGTRVVWLTGRPVPAAYGSGWDRVHLPGVLAGDSHYVYLSLSTSQRVAAKGGVPQAVGRAGPPARGAATTRGRLIPDRLQP